MIRIIVVLVLGLFMLGCPSTRHEVDVAPVEVKPIHITVDINVRVDEALDDYFGDLDKLDSPSPSKEDVQ